MILCFALYVADEAGPIASDGVCASCVGLFGNVEDAITEARTRLLDGFSVSIDVGALTEAEWNALEDVPDDFAFTTRVTL